MTARPYTRNYTNLTDAIVIYATVPAKRAIRRALLVRIQVLMRLRACLPGEACELASQWAGATVLRGRGEGICGTGTVEGSVHN